MATSAAAMRAKLFGGGAGGTAVAPSSSAGPAAAEALRAATDRLATDRAVSEQAVGLYRQKMDEAQEVVHKLQRAYVDQTQANARLQGASVGRASGGWETQGCWPCCSAPTEARVLLDLGACLMCTATLPELLP